MENHSIDSVSQIVNMSLNNKSVRIMMIDNKPHFVANDVAALFGYKRPVDTIRKHCKGTLRRLPLKTAGGEQEARFIDESDVYRLAFKSKLPEAERFQDWIVNEVLPSIRKYGAYASDKTINELQQNPVKIQELINNLSQETKLHNELKQIQIKDQQKIKELEDQLNFDKAELEIVNNLANIYMSDFLFKSFVCDIAYVFHINDRTYKFGKSDNIGRRITELKIKYGKDIKLIAIFETPVPKTMLESLFKRFLIRHNLEIPQTFVKSTDNKMHHAGKRELFTTRPGYGIAKIISNFLAIANEASIPSRIKDYITILQLENNNLKDIIGQAIDQKKLDKAFDKINTNITSQISSLPPPPIAMESTLIKELQNVSIFEGTKVCNKCNKEKPKTAFPIAKNYLTNICAACNTERRNMQKKALAEKQAEPDYKRKCQTCQLDLPACEYHAVYSVNCRQCHAKLYKETVLQNPNSRMAIAEKQEMLFKDKKHFCTVCKTESSIDNFKKNVKKKYEIENVCKPCFSIQQKKYTATRAANHKKKKMNEKINEENNGITL